MIFKKSIFLLPFFLTLACLITYAQPKQNNDKLIKIFQTNFDSTIIYHSWPSWHTEPNYRIVAKKGDSVYFFTYHNLFAWPGGYFFPVGLTSKFMNEQFVFEHTEPDTNRYFASHYVRYENKAKYWHDINSYNIWRAVEVPAETGGCDVDDGETDTFYLINSRQIKILEFYSPDFYETCKAPNEHRQTAIKTRKAVERAFETCR